MLNPERQAQIAQREALYSALLAACSISPQDVTRAVKPTYQYAVRALSAVGAVPGEVAERAARMRKAYTIPITPSLIAKHWAEFPPPRKQPAPKRHNGAQCCRWCQV